MAMKSANDSLSQRSSHQAMVTRSPNHWCATSCAITVADAHLLVLGGVSSDRRSRSGSRYVMSPAFSIAPYSKSGTAMWSSLGYGYSVPNQRSSMASELGAAT